MNTSKKQNDFYSEPSLTKETVQSKSFINLGYLNEISDGNTSFINAMLHAFKDEATIFLRELEKHLAIGDFLSMARTAHKMKPAGAYIGASTLTSLIMNLEQAARNTNSHEASSLFGQVKTMIRSILKDIDNMIAHLN